MWDLGGGTGTILTRAQVPLKHCKNLEIACGTACRPALPEHQRPETGDTHTVFIRAMTELQKFKDKGSNMTQDHTTHTFTADAVDCAAVLVCASDLDVSSLSRCVSCELCSSFRLSECWRGERSSGLPWFRATRSINEAKMALSMPATGSAKHSTTHVLPSSEHNNPHENFNYTRTLHHIETWNRKCIYMTWACLWLDNGQIFVQLSGMSVRQP